MTRERESLAKVGIPMAYAGVKIVSRDRMHARRYVCTE